MYEKDKNGRSKELEYLYPLFAMTFSALIAAIGFREKLRFQQWIGLAVGAAALVLLNL